MPMSTYGYFPGCSLHKSAQEYEQSTRLVCQTLGIGLKELENWSCCGASAAHHTKASLAEAIGAYNLTLADKDELPIVAPCPACFNRLKLVAHEIQTDPEKAEEIKNKFDLSLENQAQVLSLLEVVNQVGFDKIKQQVKADLSALKVAPYYGCLLVRPAEIAIDDPENPMSLDKLLEVVGVQVAPWAGKVICCGSTIGLADVDLLARISGEILERAAEAGAQALIVLCPLCHANLDLRQKQILDRNSKLDPIPVLYFTQLLGLAFGYTPKQVGLDKNIVDPMPLIRSVLKI